MAKASLQFSPWCAHASDGLQARNARVASAIQLQRSYTISRKCAVQTTGIVSSRGHEQLKMSPSHSCTGEEHKRVHSESKLHVRLAASACAVAMVLSSGAIPATAADGTVATSEAALELRQAYDKYSERYDDLDGGAAAEALGFPALRQQLLAQARGRVLEVAVGTGLNLPYYRWAPAPAVQPEEQRLATTTTSSGDGQESGVTSLAAVDLSPGMLAQAQRRVETNPGLSGRPISFAEADVAALPFPDGSFDSIVDTFSLCVFPDPQAAVKEMARLLSPASAGGRLLLLEHTRSDNPLLAAYQDLTAGPVAALGKGCVWNQDVEALVGRAGLRVESVQRAAAGTVELLVASKQ